jgi:membrane-associated protein
LELINYLMDLFLHLDKHLHEIILQYGTLTYAILFGVIFAETGLVFTPFLPGDSLLFAAGTIAALGALNVHLLFILLALAAVLGNTTNYWIGSYLGHKLVEKNTRLLNKEYLEKTHRFFEKHGGKTIVITRFMPIIRTFAPFVAGMGAMAYSRFFFFNLAGGVLWCASFVYGGYFFGNLPFVKNNFSFVVIAIIFISLLPGIIEFARHKLAKN